MSYFGASTIEEAVLSECRCIQEEKDASSLEMVTALAKVLEYFAERAGE